MVHCVHSGRLTDLVSSRRRRGTPQGRPTTHRQTDRQTDMYTAHKHTHTHTHTHDQVCLITTVAGIDQNSGLQS